MTLRVLPNHPNHQKFQSMCWMITMMPLGWSSKKSSRYPVSNTEHYLGVYLVCILDSDMSSDRETNEDLPCWPFIAWHCMIESLFIYSKV